MAPPSDTNLTIGREVWAPCGVPLHGRSRSLRLCRSGGTR